MPWDLLDKHRDEDWSEGYQMLVDDCIAVAEVGSEAWIAQQAAAGKSTDERDAA